MYASGNLYTLIYEKYGSAIDSCNQIWNQEVMWLWPQKTQLTPHKNIEELAGEDGNLL